MSTAYSQQFVPSAPILPVMFGLPGEKPAFGPYDVLIDSGADISIVPKHLLVRWGIPSRVEASLRGQWGERRSVHLYVVDLQIGELLLPAVYVAGDEEGDEIILGRNVLNQLPLFLDGPTQVCEVVQDVAAKRLRSQRKATTVGQ